MTDITTSPQNETTGQNSIPETQTNDSQEKVVSKSSNGQDSKAVDKTNLDKAIAEATKEASEKARKEEKDKLYPTIERHRASEKEANDKIKSLEASLSEREAKLKEFEEANLSTDEKTTRRLEELEARTSAAEKAVSIERDKRETEQKAFEMKLYRERRLREAGVEDSLADMVIGDSMESIEDSIQTTLSAQKDIFDRAYQKAHSDVRTELGKGVPENPIQPDDSHTKVTPVVTLQDRNEIASIRDPQEYKKRRKELLEAAQKQAAKQQARR